MEIHNLMEDEVFRRVNEICEEEEARGNTTYCTTYACRLDAVCYVLNRLPPRYVTSGRGLAHVEQDISSDTQLAVDLTKLAQEALKRISSVRRSYYDEDASEPDVKGPCFNFPAITGRVLNGVSFEPVEGAAVRLMRDGQPVTMYDSRWQNPYTLAAHTYGTYSFWPRPLPAQRADETAAFELQISVTADGFETLDHFLSLELTAEDSPAGAMRMGGDFHLPDLYLFPG
ncbi:MAG: competence protein ComFB [Spirochaetes bacterium]|jgi:competence protein ComFB|nr:competence protein ComFB [Spirochaetota bacterium]